MSPKEKPNVDPKHVDELLASEMNALSFQDRSKIQEEIHGVANLCPDETPDLREEALQTMQDTLDSISKKPAIYTRISSSSYIHSKDFRLRFLRCELYNARKAAERLLRFVEYMDENYDPDVLERPLKLSDLQKKTGRRSREVMECFRSAELQLIPYRDRSGRRVLVTKASTLSREVVVRNRVFDYLLLVASSDEETQTKGLVSIVWGLGEAMPWPHPTEHISSKRLLEALPIRFTTFHLCMGNNPVLQKILLAMNMLMVPNEKMRVISHVGDEMEVRYELMSFGITVDLMPFTESGNIKLKNFNTWIKARKHIEKTGDEDSRKLIECPASNDVLFRSGSNAKCHPGNAAYTDLLEIYSSECSDRGDSSIARDTVSKVMNHVFEKNGRFLEFGKCGCWIAIEDEDDLRLKIYNSMYYIFKKRDIRKRRQESKSSTYMFQRQGSAKRTKWNDSNDGSDDEQSTRLCLCLS